jgi:hypothetical protein
MNVFEQIRAGLELRLNIERTGRIRQWRTTMAMRDQYHADRDDEEESEQLKREESARATLIKLHTLRNSIGSSETLDLAIATAQSAYNVECLLAYKVIIVHPTE